MCEIDSKDEQKPSILESDEIIWEDGTPRFRLEGLGNSPSAIRKAEEKEKPGKRS